MKSFRKYIMYYVEIVRDAVMFSLFIFALLCAMYGFFSQV